MKSILLALFLIPQVLNALTCPKSLKLNEELVKDTYNPYRVLNCQRKNGEKTGPYASYFLSGQMRSKGQFLKGKAHGDFTLYYRTGEKRAELNWSHGKLDGIFEEWFKDGKKKSKVEYKNGSIVGAYQWFSRKGKKVGSNEKLSKAQKFINKKDWEGLNQFLVQFKEENLSYPDLLQYYLYQLTQAINRKSLGEKYSYSYKLMDLDPELKKENPLVSLAAFEVCMKINTLLKKGKASLVRESCILTHQQSLKGQSTILAVGIPLAIYSAYKHKNNSSGALRYCEEALKENPKDLELYQCAARAASDLKKYKLASKYIKQGLEKNKNNKQLNYLHYINLGFLGEESKSQKGLKELCKKGNKNVCKCLKTKSCLKLSQK